MFKDSMDIAGPSETTPSHQHYPTPTSNEYLKSQQPNNNPQLQSQPNQPNAPFVNIENNFDSQLIEEGIEERLYLDATQIEGNQDLSVDYDTETDMDVIMQGLNEQEQLLKSQKLKEMIGSQLGQSFMPMMPISRQDVFYRTYGDPDKTPLSYIMEENEDDFESFLERIVLVRNSLDRELGRIGQVLGLADPKSSQNYVKMSQSLTNDMGAINAVIEEPYIDQMNSLEQSEENRRSNRRTNRVSVRGGLDQVDFDNIDFRKDPSTADFFQSMASVDNIMVGEQDKIVSQMLMVEQNPDASQISKAGKQIKETLEKLTSLKQKLATFGQSIEDKIQFNPFKLNKESQIKGVPNQSKSGTSVLDSVDEAEEDQKSQITEENKKKLINLITKVSYQLEKLRFQLDYNIYPRDCQLSVLSQRNINDNINLGIRNTVEMINNDQNLLVAHQIASNLSQKIDKVVQNSKHIELVLQLQTSLRLQSRIFQHFKNLSSSFKQDSTESKILTSAALMTHKIEKRASQDIRMDKEINQHIMRLVYKRDEKSENIKQMLAQEICMYLKIDKINTDILGLQFAPHQKTHYEITLQLYYRKGGILSNKTIIRPNEGDNKFSFVFLQIPMEAFITHQVCLHIEVVRIQSDPLETGHIGYFTDVIQGDQVQETRILEGWSTINLSSTYLLNNALSGQFIPFKRLSFFDINTKQQKNDKERLQWWDLTEEMVQTCKSDLLTQMLNFGGCVSFFVNYKKLEDKLELKKATHVEIYKCLERGSLTGNKLSQERIKNYIRTPRNDFKIRINTLKLQEVPANAIVKIETFLVDHKGNLMENNFYKTQDSPQNRQIIFSSLAQDLREKTEFLDQILVQFPVTEKLDALKELSFIFLIKVAEITEKQTPFSKSKTRALLKFVQDSSQFRFVTKYFAVMPVVQQKEKRIVQNGLQSPLTLYEYQDAQFRQMLHRQATQLHRPDKIQTWMFNPVQNLPQNCLYVDTQLYSNLQSNSTMLNYVINLKKPQDLTEQAANVLLQKLRKTVTKEPVQLLIHYEQILDKVFQILESGYTIKKEQVEGDITTQAIIEKMQISPVAEGGCDMLQQDVAFEILLLIIDMFHEVYPSYKDLFEDYMQNKFKNPKIFVPLSIQLMQISVIFQQKIKDQNRIALIQTLSYLHLLLKLIRISFLNHQSIQESQRYTKEGMRNNQQANARNIIFESQELSKGPLNSQINEGFDQDDRTSGFFGDQQQLNEISEVDNELEESRKTTPVFGGLQDSQRSTMSENGPEIDMTERSMSTTSNNETMAPPEFLTGSRDENTGEGAKMIDAKIHGLMKSIDRDNFQTKKNIRQSIRNGELQTKSNFLASFINQSAAQHLANKQLITEEEIQKAIGDCITEIFIGCQSDNTKVKLCLNEILLKNYNKIFEEFSLICGSQIAYSILDDLVLPKTLDEQLKLMNQFDIQESSNVDPIIQSTNRYRSTSFDAMVSKSRRTETSSRALTLESELVHQSSNEIEDSYAQKKIRVVKSYIDQENFPFGSQIDSQITITTLNFARVIAMGNILYNRVLEKIPGNRQKYICQTVIQFSAYVRRFSTQSLIFDHTAAASSNGSNDPFDGKDVTDQQILIRVHTFYFLQQLLFYIYKTESLHFAKIKRDEETKLFESQKSGQPQIKNMTPIRITSLVQTPNSYLNKVVHSFLSTLNDLINDLLFFHEHKQRVQKLIDASPLIASKLDNFAEKASIVVITLISHASKSLINRIFFNRPSVLAQLIDQLNQLDTKIEFALPIGNYFEKQKFDIMVQFNQNMCELIHNYFGRNLPELYVPVVNMLIYRNIHLYLQACEFQLREQSNDEAQKQSFKDEDRISYGDDLQIDMEKPIKNMWKILNEYKYKTNCLQFLLKTAHGAMKDPQAKNHFGTQQQQADQSQQMTFSLDFGYNFQGDSLNLARLFCRAYRLYHESDKKNSVGLNLILRLLCEIAIVEIDMNNGVVDATKLLLYFFLQINYLNLDISEVKFLIELLKRKLRISAENMTNLRISKERFVNLFQASISKVEDIYFTLQKFKQVRQGSNLYLQGIYGARVIELMAESDLYFEIMNFSRKEYFKLLKGPLEWNVEFAFLNYQTFQTLKNLEKDRMVTYNNQAMRTEIYNAQINAVVDAMISCRHYSLALDLNDEMKNIFKTNYDLSRIQKPLEREAMIYQRMNSDKKQNYTTYFKLQFIGNGHFFEFKDKTFILRSRMNEQALNIEDEMRDYFDKDIKFVETEWPSDEELSKGHTKYCHLVRVEPLTMKEIEQFDLYESDVGEKLDLQPEEYSLMNKVQDMPVKLSNYYLQNFQRLFYYKESVRIDGVDSVAFDQQVSIFVVKNRFPTYVGIQKVIQQHKKLVSSVRLATNEVKETDIALVRLTTIVRESAINRQNLILLETALRRSLITEINGGFQRYIDNFFLSESSMKIPGREELLPQLYLTMSQHFKNVQTAIQIFSNHAASDSASAQFHSKLSQLKRLMQQVEKKVKIMQQLEEKEKQREQTMVTNAVIQQAVVRDELKKSQRAYIHPSLDKVDDDSMSTATHQTAQTAIAKLNTNQFVGEDGGQEETESGSLTQISGSLINAPSQYSKSLSSQRITAPINILGNVQQQQTYEEEKKQADL